MVDELKSYGVTPDIHDPWIDKDEAQREYGITPVDDLTDGSYQAVIIAVAHKEFKQMGAANIRALCAANGVVYDIKYLLSPDESDGRL